MRHFFFKSFFFLDVHPLPFFNFPSYCKLNSCGMDLPMKKRHPNKEETFLINELQKGVPLTEIRKRLELEIVQTGDKMRIRLALRKTFKAAKDAPFMKKSKPYFKKVMSKLKTMGYKKRYDELNKALGILNKSDQYKQEEDTPRSVQNTHFIKPAGLILVNFGLSDNERLIDIIRNKKYITVE